MNKRTEYHKKWRKKNKKHFDKYQREYKKRIYYENPLIRKKHILQNKINAQLRIYKKGIIDKNLNYSFYELIKHLENQFNKNMNWLNYGIYWEIDHIKPIKNAIKNNDINELINLYKLENLRPLEKEKNKIKG
jgi:5-methylcytosine-specific restriction endonuclease McrA